MRNAIRSARLVLILAMVFTATSVVAETRLTQNRLALTRDARLEVVVGVTVDSEPDTANIQVSVHADAASADAARPLARTRMTALIARLAAGSVPPVSLVITPQVYVEEIREEWIENEDLIYGEVVAQRATQTAWLNTSDMALAARLVDLLAREGEAVSFQPAYSLSFEAREKAEQTARRKAVADARSTARTVARANGWRIAELINTRRNPPADGAADLGGAGPEDREWGAVSLLAPERQQVYYDLIVTYRLVR